MRWPWSKRKANQDGGPATVLFSFDRERERQMAERYSGGRQDWLDARYRLIDAVLDYRRTGTLSGELLEACEAEHEVASWAYSEGVRRLVELSRDGHAAAGDRIETMLTSKDWRVRYEALLTSFQHAGDRDRQIALLLRALDDRSGRIRARLSGDAVHAHLIECVDQLEQSAGGEKSDDIARAQFIAAFYLRRNERTGQQGLYGGGEEDCEQIDEAWTTFRRQHRP